MKHLKSLNVRLVGTYLVLAAVLLGATGLIFSKALSDYAWRVHMQRYLESLARAEAMVRESDLPADRMKTQLERVFPDLAFEQVPISVLIVQKAGAPDRLPAIPEPGIKLNVLTPKVMTGLQGTARLIYMGSTPPVQYTVRMKDPNPPVFRTLYREVATVGLLGLLLAAFMGFLFSRWLSRPINRLTAATAAVAEGDFLSSVPPTGTRELDLLAESFNRMVTRLSESFRSLQSERDVARRFASDAAHELRTPLTALRTYVETVEERSDRLPKVLPGMGRQVDRLGGIIDGLLQLTRLSEGTGIELAEGDLTELMADLEPGYRMLAERGGHTFTVQAPEEPLPVRHDPRLLEMALTNLVENACKFTPVGGRIRVELHREDHAVVMAVTDTGPGIPDEELQHIFQRFHRGIATQQIPGNGLGLAIVQEAVRRMGGTVGVQSRPGEGSTFSIRLPAA